MPSLRSSEAMMEKKVALSIEVASDKSLIGSSYIQERWRFLTLESKSWFISSGHFSERGLALKPEIISQEIDSLLFNVGILHCCVLATLPMRGEKGAIVPADALQDDVLHSAAEMAGLRISEPVFLRLGLRAVRQHQIAWLLTRLPPTSYGMQPGFTAALALFSIVLVLCSPAFLALGLIAALHSDTLSALGAFYALGLALLMAGWVKNLERKAEEKSSDEAAYEGWYRIETGGTWLAVGVGAAAYLKNMIQKGANVPPIALDLCALLSVAVCNRGEDKI